MTLKTYWQHLVTREKALFKSATMWLAALLAVAPEALSYARDHWADVASFLPPVLQSKGLGWVSLAIFLCRLKSMVKLPPPPLPPPVSR